MKQTFLRGMANVCLTLTFLFAVGILTASAQDKKACSNNDACCSRGKKSSSKALVCKLTGKEMLERKASIIAALKSYVIERKELRNGYSYKFKADDQSIDQLTAFIKFERQCCDFFDYSVFIKDDFAYLELRGPKGTKQFIDAKIAI